MDSQMDLLIEQRVKTEFEILDKTFEILDKRELENLHYPIQFSKIEHLKTYKQIRLEFAGYSMTCWRNGQYTFVIKYNDYPFQPPIIQFDQSIRHHQIIPGTGKYCLPELSNKYWKPSMRLEEIIFKVIETFHQNPINADYPVDLSIVQLYMEDQNGYKQYVEVCKQNSLFNIKALSQERDNEKEREARVNKK